MMCEKNKCTGCFACYNICPKQAIEMKEDSNGFIYPYINEEKCVNCGLCKKICPSLKKVNGNESLSCYAAKAYDKSEQNSSSSGGLAAVFTKSVIENGGIVYGAIFDNKKGFHHERIDTLEKAILLKGSKYVHSYIKECYAKVKKDLNDKKLVLFIGTPCQIAGLKSFLLKEYDNLICVDIICHGVPSQKYLFEELKNNNINIENIKRIFFRKNNNFHLDVLDFNNSIIYSKDMNESYYYKGFFDGFIYRENCYECPYANSKRVSDITIGDFWGLGCDSKLFSDKENGVSVVIVSTKKGIEFFNSQLSDLIYEIRNIDEAINGNTQLRNASIKPKKYYKFKSDYEKLGFEKAYYKNRKWSCIKGKLKKNIIIKKIIKKIRRR